MAQTRKHLLDALCEQQLDPVAVHDIGGVDDGLEYQSFGVHQQMALAAFYLLAAVKAADPTNTGGLDRLVVDTARAGLGIPSEAHA